MRLTEYRYNQKITMFFCEVVTAGLPLLRIKASRTYAVAELRRRVESTITPQSDTPEEPVIPSISELNTHTPESDSSEEPALPLVVTTNVEAVSQTCPKCGESMVIRQAKTGTNAGNEFWGCSAFPKCRTVVPIDTEHL